MPNIMIVSPLELTSKEVFYVDSTNTVREIQSTRALY